MGTEETKNNGKSRPQPPGRIKIVQALKKLLEEKDFNSITWAEIARTAEVNEGLIYKYFKDSRNLLHQVLEEYLEKYMLEIEFALKGIDGSFNKLRKFIWSQINACNADKVFARILTLEVRNFAGYYDSHSYKIIKQYNSILLDIIKEGVEKGEIRDDISLGDIKRIVFGAAEHLCLPGIVFDREFSPDTLTESLCGVIFPGIKKQ